MTIAKTYQPVTRTRTGGYAGAVLVGTHSAIIGWTMDPELDRKDLLGFAIRRKEFDPGTGEELQRKWLGGQKRFPGMQQDSGIDVSSLDAPFQRFRWSDYTLKPELSYRYEIFPMRGTPGAMGREYPLVLNFRPSGAVVDDIGIYGNRGVTAAHAYLRRFGNRKPADVPDNAAYRWLSRGLKESLLAFISSARRGDALHLAIYEFYDDEIAAALKAAKTDGVNVEILYHAKAGQRATRKNKATIARHRLIRVAHPRTLTGNISHNKFMVRLVKGIPRAVWTGSANFTENAFHYQTNMALTLSLPAVARAYEEYYQLLKTDPKRIRKNKNKKGVRDLVADIIAKHANGLEDPIKKAQFSPVRGLHVVEAAQDLLSNAASCAFISAPFSIDKRIIATLHSNSKSILEYGLANSTVRKKVKALKRRNTRFFTPSRLETYMGRKWDAKAFGAHKIHAKTLVVDPWGDNPRVLLGSANFSEASCKVNDENTLLVEGDKRFAAIVATEFMRMLDHYKSRHFINEFYSRGMTLSHHLKTSGKWSGTAFNPRSRSHKFQDRLVFSGK